MKPFTKFELGDLSEIEGEMLKAAIDLLREYCAKEIKRWPESPLAEWYIASNEVRKRIKEKLYTDECPICGKPILKPPCVCEKCKTGVSMSRELIFSSERDPETQNTGEAKLNLYNEWRRVTGLRD
ncbi:MAG: hypothetical protein BroJett006_08690 [Betaproteobacteria bacterium]|nr:MAG: hypothetical protein BroJett006_08690 [Betaproteobacteria bacterium]